MPYDPPTNANDPRICKRCLSVTGSWSGAKWWPIQNSRTNIYHSGGEYGVTDCGVDATKLHYLWPL
jgi:hypothetical protein